MNNFIEELFYGNLEPQELNKENELRLKEKLKKLCHLEESIRNSLGGELSEMFEAYVRNYGDFSAACSADSFVSRFKMGSRLTYETFFE